MHQLIRDKPMQQATHVDPTTGSGVIILTVSSILQFMDVHSGGIVALCAIGGLVCTIIGMRRKKRK